MRLLRPSSICLMVGIGLCIAGFFLPAVRFPPDSRPEGQWGPGATGHDLSGWECAEVTIVSTVLVFRNPKAGAIPIALSGWINPLLLFYLLAGAVKRLNQARVWIAAAIVVCCVAMWIQLAADHIPLLLGHYLWIAGIALILAAPLANRVSSRNHAGETVM